RRVLKLSDRTSVVSDDVIAAARERAADGLVIAICAERIAFLKSLKTFPVFGRGWIARVNGVRAAALAMAQSRPLAPVANASTEASPGKAVVPATIPAGPASAGAAIAAGAASAVATSRLEIAALVVAAAAVTALAIFLVWRWRHRRHQEAAVSPFVERKSNELG
ncbi:MAG: secretion activator protein, partial [Afipia sp.]|nr:secretion activator protein [Afipia sp.]